MNVDDVIAERIAAARARREEAKRHHAAVQSARQAGLGARHAAKLRRQANTQPDDVCTCTYGAACARCTDTEGEGQ